jgi:hypothetical protein
MKAMVWVGLLAAGIGFTGLPPVTRVVAGGLPKVAVEKTSHDFGKVMEDQAMTHTFVIKNCGGQPLKIESVDPDCACIVANYDHSIDPGGQGKITLSIKPFSVVHQFNKQTRVRFNDPDKGQVVFTLVGTAQPYIEIQPSRIVRFRGAPGDNLQARVRLISQLSDPFRITDVRTNIPDMIEVSLKVEVPDKVYVLTVKNKCSKPVIYRGLVELITNYRQRPRLIVRVFGNFLLTSGGLQKVGGQGPDRLKPAQRP